MKTSWTKRGLSMVVAAILMMASSAASAEGSGAQQLFREGVEALRNEQFADAASMFRLSYQMERRAATICNLALTYDRWGGHERQALDAYEQCAEAEDGEQFRDHARERIDALRARLESSNGPPPSAEPPAVRPPTTFPTPSPAPSRSVRIAITWEVTQTLPGCFYFCGPGALGRSEQLGETATWRASGQGAVLTFESGQVFIGRREGNTVVLRRTSTHQHSGTWVVSETIEGVFRGAVLYGVYRYEECERGNASNCPGRCRIQASVTARPQVP